MPCTSLQCKWASARHDLLYMMLRLIWQSFLGAVQSSARLAKACWCQKTLRQHASIALARFKHIKGQSVLFQNLWKLYEPQLVEARTCSLCVPGLIYPPSWNDGENKDGSLQERLHSQRMHCTYLLALSESLGTLIPFVHVLSTQTSICQSTCVH